MANRKSGNRRLLESLERRTLLSSATLSSGVLTITGNSSSANDLGAYLSGSNIVAQHNGATNSYSASSVSKIVINGGSSSDRIWITDDITKPSSLKGNGGNDTIWGGSGKDTIYGGSGDDSLIGNDGSDTLRGDDGADTLYGGAGSDYLSGDGGNDVRYDEQFSGGYTSDVSISNPDPTPDPTPTPSSSEPAPTPTPSPSGLTSASLSSGVLTINGNSSSANTINVGLSGSDIVVTHNGASGSFASSSVTRININGGSSGDNISVSSAITKPTYIKGNGGNDSISGGAGRDTVFAGSGNDLVYGNDGNDSLRGEDGEDTLYGQGGTDTLSGDSGNDVRYDEQFSGGVSSDVPISNPDPEPEPTDPPDDGGGSIPNDTSATAPRPVITALYGTSVMAGQAIHVHGTGSTLNSGAPQNALYEWNFGDSGSDYNSVQGFNAAHIYEEPGTYKVTLTVTNQAGKVNQTSINVTVSSNSRKKIYVSSSGSDSNSGTSSSSPIKSWSKAASIANSTSNLEVLFRRGDTFNAGNVMDINGDNVVIGAYGTGNRPVINWNVSVSGYPSVVSPDGDDVTIRDLTFTSSVSNAPQAVRAAGNNVTVLDNQFLKLGYAINANGKPNGLLVQGNVAPDVSGIKSYFVWSEGSDHVFLGNTVRNSREEHAIRVVGTDRVLVWDNDLTNTTGEASGDDTPKGALTLHKGSYYWVARNNLNKGPVAIGPLGNGDGLEDKAGRFRYGVFDGNVFDTKLFVDHGAERIMIRNNVIKSGDSAITVEGYNSSYDRTTIDVVIVNNTVINNNSTGRAVKIESGAQSVSLLNNLYVAPNITTGSGASGSVWVESSGMGSIKSIDNNVWANASASLWAQNGQNFVGTSTSSQSGYKDPGEWNGMTGVGTDVFSDVSISSSYTPSSTTLVNSTGESYMGVFQDMYGKTRSAFSAGAVEV